MTAAADLREITNQLDGVLTGWIADRYSYMTTATGTIAEKLVRKLRERHFKQWCENCVLRGRLAKALADLEGARNANEALTNELERLRGP